MYSFKNSIAASKQIWVLKSTSVEYENQTFFLQVSLTGIPKETCESLRVVGLNQC